ncbi:MAG: hypothetical protein R2741_04200 [Methanolobus sp.]
MHSFDKDPEKLAELVVELQDNAQAVPLQRTDLERCCTGMALWTLTRITMSC